jgi:DNA ligase-associated metallophosphoesterase
VLFATDLHLGRAETLQASGIGVPPTGAGELEHLARVAEELSAAEIVILGDFLHAPAGVSSELLDRITRWRTALSAELRLIRGNHDRLPADRWEALGLRPVESRWITDTLVAVHDPADCPDGRACLAGHLHPGVRIGPRIERVRVPAFVREADRLILPALGRFTGVHEVARRAGRTRYAIIEDRVVEEPA